MPGVASTLSTHWAEVLPVTTLPLFDLESVGPDTYVGYGPQYPWGGLYGGQIVAQALRAASYTVNPALHAHSLRAYFIRRGDHTQPIRFEVDRIRDGRSFATRRVVAHQAVGAILNLEASFHVQEDTEDLQRFQLSPSLPRPDALQSDAWTDSFDRCAVRDLPDGRLPVWMKVNGDLPADPLLHNCWLAYMSDDIPIDSMRHGHPVFCTDEGHQLTMSASLDHTIWFHRPLRADQWHLYDMQAQTYQGARGLSLGRVFSADGVHVATVAQEGLVRRARQPRD